MPCPEKKFSHRKSAKTRLIPAICLLTSLSIQAEPDQTQWECRADANNNWACAAKTNNSTNPKATSANTVTKSGATTKPGTVSEPSPSIKVGTLTALNDEATHFANWDWVPKKELKDSCTPKPGCDGAYVAPENTSPDAALKPEEAPTRISADSSDSNERLIKLEGDVIIDQGYRRIRSGKAVYDRDSANIDLSGGFEIREPNSLLRGGRANFDKNTGAGSYSNAQSLSYDSGVRFTAGTLTKLNDSEAELRDVSYSQCTPDDLVWHLEAEKMRLNNESGFGTARNMTLNLFDVPVLWSPWFLFPIDDRRLTGLLFPTISYSADDGFDYEQPIYLNLAPNYDMTISPRWIENRGLLNQVEFRHLSSKTNLVVNGAYLDEDEFINPDAERRAAANLEPDVVEREFETGDDRWSTGVIFNASLARYWSAAINYSRVSDIDYLDDLDKIGLGFSRTDNLVQQGRITFNNAHWLAQLSLTEYQTLFRTNRFPYKKLPELRLENLSNNGNFAADWLFTGYYTGFDNVRSQEDGFNRVTGNRAFIETGISFPMVWAPGYIIPTAKVRYLSYDLDQPETADEDFIRDPDAATALGTIDMGLIFERATRFGNQSITQTLEPRLYYFVSENEVQDQFPLFDTRELDFSYSQLFRDTRYTGYDRLDDANQLSMAITNRWISDRTGDELLSISFGQIVYFDDREVTLTSSTEDNQASNSNFATEIRFQPNDHWRLNNSLVWDHKDGTVENASVNLQYTPDNQSLVNFGYRFDREGNKISGNIVDLEQFDLSAVYPINDQWKFFTRFKYNATFNSRLEDTSGFEYQSCCWKSRVLYQRVVDDEFLDSSGKITTEQDYRFVIEFELTGLGGLGGQIQSLLKESILGYEDISDE